MNQEYLKDLRNAEEEEIQIAEIYDVLLQDGLANCLPEELKNEFISDLEILRDESIIHNSVIKRLVEKYDRRNK